MFSFNEMSSSLCCISFGEETVSNITLLSKGPVIIYVEGGGGRKIGGKAILNEQRGGLLCFSGTKIRGNYMIQQDL